MSLPPDYSIIHKHHSEISVKRQKTFDIQPLSAQTKGRMDADLDHLRTERLRVWEQAKALIERAGGRTWTAAEQMVWDDLNERLCQLDKMLYRYAGSTNTTYWGNASGPPVSAGGGGGSSYAGFNNIRPSERDAYMRGVHEGQEIIKAINDGRNPRGKIEVTALGDQERVFIDALGHLPADPPPKALEPLPAERACTACGIGEYSRIGAGPFGKDGVCRYCAELNGLVKPAPKELVAAKSGPPPVWLQLAVRYAAAGIVAGIVLLIVWLVGLVQ